MHFHLTCIFYLNTLKYIIYKGQTAEHFFSYLLNVQHILCPRPVYRTLVMVTHNISFCQSRMASIKLHFLFWKLTKSLTVHDSHIKPVFTAAERKWDKKIWTLGKMYKLFFELFGAECLSGDEDLWMLKVRGRGENFSHIYANERDGTSALPLACQEAFLCHILSQHKVPIEAVRLLHVLSLIQPFNLSYSLRVCCMCAVRMGKF